MRVALLALLLCGCAHNPQDVRWVIIGNTGSMRPTFVGGELRVPVKIAFKDLRAGMIGLRDHGDWVVPHRLVRLERPGRWVTKGDANPSEDISRLTPDTFCGIILP